MKNIFSMKKIFSFLKPIIPVKERKVLKRIEYTILHTKLEEHVIVNLQSAQEHEKLLDKIFTETKKHNANNVTRTNAYLSILSRRPELHCAFLAHTVSKNGGYYMTDLKSSYMDAILPHGEKETYFLFLEECNAAIFQDAYPQLLLYDESTKQCKPLYFLLSHFHVSRFMVPVWNLFHQEGNSTMLTTALIINEQKMLEKRVLLNRKKSRLPFSDILFQLQEKLGFTSIYFTLAGGR
ncbi:DUF2515 family protein [Mesobacillus zeae]|uniref:DUF2515 domain-containing protein n=1 Tax=Mesobacillus zeae TaxID=1917180 RepID=A0A398B6R7_9BACI|nr:DUF2515 family protein [Mesobacillus zeae]RID85507.1 DUF2515 domain-containing protein [Mesobacillus zeae]